jgi:hypothetical protein
MYPFPADADVYSGLIAMKHVRGDKLRFYPFVKRFKPFIGFFLEITDTSGTHRKI